MQHSAYNIKSWLEIAVLSQGISNAKLFTFTRWHGVVLYIEYRHPDGSEGPDLYYLSEDFINAVARKNIAEGKGRYCFA